MPWSSRPRTPCQVGFMPGPEPISIIRVTVTYLYVSIDKVKLDVIQLIMQYPFENWRGPGKQEIES